jgi:hypothetical protein
MVYRFIHKVKEIYEGWYNFIFRTDSVETIAAKRIKICKACDFMILGVCSKCNCPNVGKVRSLSSYCPIGKWDSEIIGNSIPDVPMETFKTSDEYVAYINRLNKPINV